MSFALGIDVGTTYTAAATVSRGRAEVAALGHSSLTVPSIVYVREDRSTLVGQTSVRRAASDPEGLARDFKRRMGDPVPLLLRGTPFAPEQLTGSLLSWVVESVVEQQGAEPDRVALTHPANWTEFQTSLLRGATQIAGLPSAALVTEPEAAAIAYATTRTVEAGSTIAVYDLGGGTFDASVLRRRDDGRFELVGTPQGIDRLGGIDFDLAVMGWVERQLGETWTMIDRDDPTLPQAMHTLRTECVAAKEELSTDNETTIAVLLPGVQRELRLTRSEFEDMIRPSVNLTVAALQRAIAAASIPADELDSVLLVGGSSRIPLVAEVVAAEIDRPTVTDTHPKFAVALGAALWAANETDGHTRIPGDPAVRELSIPTRVPAADPTVEETAGAAAATTASGPAESDRRRVDSSGDETDGAAGGGRRPVALIIGGVVALAALIAIGLTFLGGGDDDIAAEPPTTLEPDAGPTTEPVTEPPATSTAPPLTTASPTTASPTTVEPVLIDSSSFASALSVVAAELDGRPVVAGAATPSGAEVPSELSPGGLVAWSAAQIGAEVPADPVQIYEEISRAGLLAPVADVDPAAHPGLVLLRRAALDTSGFPAVGITLGDGRIVVADEGDGAVTITDDVSRFDLAGVLPAIGGAADLPAGGPAIVTTASRQVGEGVGVALIDDIVLVGGGAEPGVVTAVGASVRQDEIGRARVSTAEEPLLGDLVALGGRGYLSVPSDQIIARIELGGDGLSATPIPVSRGTGDLAVNGDTLFASAGTFILVVGAESGTSANFTEIEDGALADVHVAFGSPWATDAARNTIRRIDIATGFAVEEIAVGALPVGIIDAAGLLWVTVANENRVIGINPDTREIVHSIEVGSQPWGFATAGDRLWVTNRGDGTVSLIDLATASEIGRVAVGSEPDGIAAVGDVAWVLTADGVLSRLQAVPARP